MKKVLIIYATKAGQTQRIAERLAGHLNENQIIANIFEVQSIPDSINIAQYDGVVVGSPVHGGKLHCRLSKWVKENRDAIGRIPGAFFSVCLGILEKNNPAAVKAESKIAEDFFRSSQWYPTIWTIFAGALPYTKYNWFIRMIMKRIVKKAGGDTDTSRDYEYTDWIKVREFAHQVQEIVSGPDQPQTKRSGTNGFFFVTETPPTRS